MTTHARVANPKPAPGANMETFHPNRYGSDWYYAKGCRCDECGTAHREKRRRYRAGQRQSGNPNYAKVRKVREHGSYLKYQLEGCRCDACTADNRARQRADTTAARARRKAAEPRKPPTTYEPPAPGQCGEQLPGGGWCARLYPCRKHSVNPTTARKGSKP